MVSACRSDSARPESSLTSLTIRAARSSRDAGSVAAASKLAGVWIAGAPGTCVVHSADGGKTWQSSRTEQTAPLRGLWFIDEHRGWAVGSLGTILHTRDGGQTWRLQRAGGTRAALLGIFSEPSRVPLELVADQAGNNGFLTAIEIIGRGEEAGAARRAELTSPRRMHAAVVATAGSAADSAWKFPLPEPGLLPTSIFKLCARVTIVRMISASRSSPPIRWMNERSIFSASIGSVTR